MFVQSKPVNQSTPVAFVWPRQVVHSHWQFHPIQAWCSLSSYCTTQVLETPWSVSSTIFRAICLQFPSLVPPPFSCVLLWALILIILLLPPGAQSQALLASSIKWQAPILHLYLHSLCHPSSFNWLLHHFSLMPTLASCLQIPNASWLYIAVGLHVPE